MKKYNIELAMAVLALSVTACSTPKQDVAGLTAAIDAGYQGHYGQSLKHEEMADEQQKIADRVLKHWQKDQYWNIDEKQKAMDAIHEAAEHRKASEKEMCLWLQELHPQYKHEWPMHHGGHEGYMHDEHAEHHGRHGHHGEHQEHHGMENLEHVAAYFKTGSAVPERADDAAIAHLGHFLENHPDATVMVTASTDTVGDAASNQKLSEKRAEAVKELLIKDGAKAAQINTKAVGKAAGPDHMQEQKNRVATIALNMPPHHEQASHQIDCSLIK